MRHAALTLVAMTMAGVLPRQAGGQQPSDSAARRDAVVQSLNPGQRIRIRAAALPLLEGSFVRRENSTLLLRQDTVPARIRIPEIERLWVRGRATKTGAIIGGAVGLAAGLAYGYLIGEVICDDPDCQANDAAAIGGLGAAGLISGALVGGAVGAAIPKWRLRFP